MTMTDDRQTAVDDAGMTPTATFDPTMLRAALTAALVSVGTDASTPVLTGVLVTWAPGEPVTFTSTDRYRLTKCDVTAHQDVVNDHRNFGASELTGSALTTGEARILLPSAAVKRWIKALPAPTARKGFSLPAEVTVDEDRATLTVRSFDGDAVDTARGIDGTFPQVQKLIPTEFAGVEVIGVNPKYLADVGKLPTEKNAPVRMSFNTATRPTVVTYTHSDGGYSWTYLIMPVRLSG